MSRGCAPRRDAHADLARALGDEVSHDAVNSDQRQQERHAREAAHQKHKEPIGRDGLTEHFIHRLDLGDGLIFI